jgi:hypothetical protein
MEHKRTSKIPKVPLAIKQLRKRRKPRIKPATQKYADDGVKWSEYVLEVQQRIKTTGIRRGHMLLNYMVYVVEH